MFTIYNIETGVIRCQQTGTAADAKLNLGEGEAYLEGNFDIENKRVVDGALVDMEQPAFDPVAAARYLRTGFLAETDWTQTTDSPLVAEQKTAWADYRQELRDFPAKVAEVAADEDRAVHLSSIEFVEELLPIPPDGG